MTAETVIALGVAALALVAAAVAFVQISGIRRKLSAVPADGDVFETWSYETERPMSLELLREMIRLRLPGAVYRCKGIVYADEDPDTRMVLQTVGRRSEIEPFDGWGERPPRTRVVAIGARGGFDARELQAAFDGCVATEVVARQSR